MFQHGSGSVEVSPREPRLVDVGGVPVDLNTIPAEVVAEHDRATAWMNAAVDEIELKTAREAVARALANVGATKQFNDALATHLGAGSRRSA
jgi:hypothetical protein